VQSCPRAVTLPSLPPPALRRAQRQFNTAHLLGHYMGEGALAADAIAWNLNDPNVLSIRLPGALRPLRVEGVTSCSPQACCLGAPGTD